MKRRLRRLRRIVLGGLILGVSTSLVRILGWTASGESRDTIWIPPCGPLRVSVQRWTGYHYASVVGWVGSRGWEKRVVWLRAR